MTQIIEAIPLSGALVSRTFLAGLFCASGISKLASLRTFENTLRSYDIVPGRLAATFGPAIAMIEVLVALLLTSGIWVKLGAVFAALLLFTFSVAISVNLIRGRRWLNCGCFGAFEARISWSQVARNLSILLFACVSLLREQWSVDEGSLRLNLSVFVGLVGLIILALITLSSSLASTPSLSNEKGR